MSTNPEPRRTRLAAEIRAEMARQELSPTLISTATGIKLHNLRPSLKGDRGFNLDELDQISGTLGMTLSDLVARSEETAAA